MSGQVAKGNVSALATNGTFNIQPPAGTEWSIHNIYYSQTVSMSIMDGTTSPVSSGPMYVDVNGAGSVLSGTFNLTNDHYIQVTNTGASASNISFDGKVTSP